VVLDPPGALAGLRLRWLEPPEGGGRFGEIRREGRREATS